MKAINYLLSLGLVVCASLSINAQEYKVPVQNVKEGKLILNDFAGDLPIEGYSGTEIIITSDKEGGTPDRAKGLKPVYASGTDNTGLAVSVEKNGNQVTLQCLLPITQSAKYKIRVPDNFSVRVDNECGHAGDVEVANIKGEVDVKNCHNIKLKNISGPLVLSTISGDIEVAFSSAAKVVPISLSTISGEIDVTIPAKSGVDVELETISGGIYSDFEFPSGDKKMQRIGGNSIKAQLNGGGTKVKITNISGSIYFRKGN